MKKLSRAGLIGYRSMAVALLLLCGNVMARGLNGLLKGVSDGLSQAADSLSGDLSGDVKSSKISKIELGQGAEVDVSDNILVLLGLFLEKPDDQLTPDGMALKKMLGAEDVCVAIRNMSLANQQTLDLFRPKPGNCSHYTHLVRRLIDDDSITADTHAGAFRVDLSGPYKLVLKRPDGTFYQLISDHHFYSEVSVREMVTDNGKAYLAQQEEAKKLKEEKEAELKASLENEERIFQSYARSSATLEEAKRDAANAKQAGKLVFKNIYLGMPLNKCMLILDELSGGSIVKVIRKQAPQRDDSPFGALGSLLSDDNPYRDGVKVDALKVLFDGNPVIVYGCNEGALYNAVNGDYFIGKEKIFDLRVTSIRLNRSVLNKLFGVGDLNSKGVLDKFVKAYKINVPSIWQGESKFEESYDSLMRKIMIEEISYSYRDPSGFLLHFVYNNTNAECVLELSQTKAEADLEKSFD